MSDSKYCTVGIDRYKLISNLLISSNNMTRVRKYTRYLLSKLYAILIHSSMDMDKLILIMKKNTDRLQKCVGNLVYLILEPFKSVYQINTVLSTSILNQDERHKPRGLYHSKHITCLSNENSMLIGHLVHQTGGAFELRVKGPAAVRGASHFSRRIFENRRPARGSNEAYFINDSREFHTRNFIGKVTISSPYPPQLMY